MARHEKTDPKDRYSKVARSHWSEGWYRDLPPAPCTPQYLWWFLVTALPSPIPGLAPVGLGHVGDKMGCELLEVVQSMEMLKQAGKVRVYRDLIWLPELMAERQNQPTSPTQAKSWGSEAAAFPHSALLEEALVHIASLIESDSLRAAFIEGCGEAFPVIYGRLPPPGEGGSLPETPESPSDQAGGTRGAGREAPREAQGEAPREAQGEAPREAQGEAPREAQGEASAVGSAYQDPGSRIQDHLEEEARGGAGASDRRPFITSRNGERLPYDPSERLAGGGASSSRRWDAVTLWDAIGNRDGTTNRLRSRPPGYLDFLAQVLEANDDDAIDQVVTKVRAEAIHSGPGYFRRHFNEDGTRAPDVPPAPTDGRRRGRGGYSAEERGAHPAAQEPIRLPSVQELAEAEECTEEEAKARLEQTAEHYRARGREVVFSEAVPA